MSTFACVIRAINRIVGKFSSQMSAVLDPEDGSITIDEKLYRRMDKDCNGRLEDVYCFQINADDHKYGWICNPKKSIFKNDSEDIQRPVAQVQFNTKTNTIGFMPTNPTLALMFYNWGADPDKKIRANITRHKCRDFIYYQIEL